MKKIKRFFKKLITLSIIIILLSIFIIVYVKNSTREQIRRDLNSIDSSLFSTAIILGASVKKNTPSPMLKDRLDAGIELYKAGKVAKLLMSGDGRQKSYNEVNVMESYAISNGVPKKDIAKDSLGLSTFESIERMKTVFGIKNAVIITQEFHINRAIYIANKLGIASIGYPAKNIPYNDLTYLYFRDSLASIKDFFQVLI